MRKSLLAIGTRRREDAICPKGQCGWVGLLRESKGRDCKRLTTATLTLVEWPVFHKVTKYQSVQKIGREKYANKGELEKRRIAEIRHSVVLSS